MTLILASPKAEKLEALVQLGLANTRMKDFYNLVALSNLFEFEGQPQADAIPTHLLSPFSDRHRDGVVCAPDATKRVTQAALSPCGAAFSLPCSSKPNRRPSDVEPVVLY